MVFQTVPSKVIPSARPLTKSRTPTPCTTPRTVTLYRMGASASAGENCIIILISITLISGFFTNLPKATSNYGGPHRFL